MEKYIIEKMAELKKVEEFSSLDNKELIELAVKITEIERLQGIERFLFDIEQSIINNY